MQADVNHTERWAEVLTGCFTFDREQNHPRQFVSYRYGKGGGSREVGSESGPLSTPSPVAVRHTI